MTDTQPKKRIDTTLLHFPILKIGAFSARDWFIALSVAIAINWKPLTTWVLGVDAAGRVPFLLIALSLILYARRILRTSFRFPLVVYCLVAVYMFINGYIRQGYLTYPADGVYLMFCAALQAPAIMLLVAAQARKDYDTTVDWLTLALYAYVLLSLFCSGITRTSRYNLEINANEIALYTAILSALLLLKHFRGRLPFIPLLLLEAVPVYVIILTGSRMALAMIALLFAFAIFIRQNIKNVRSVAISVLLTGVFALGMAYVLKNTQIGARMLGTTTQTEQEKAVGTSSILDTFGDRGLQYFYSWPYFVENPIFGIGFKNWILYNPYKLVCHSEYMVQYVENGLLAFIPYMIFFLSLLVKAWKGRRSEDRRIRRSALLLFATMLAISFSNSVLWSHDQFCVFVIYALCFSLETPPARKRRKIRFVLSSPEKKRRP